MSMRAELPTPSGQLTIIKRTIEPHIRDARLGLILPDEQHGHYRRDRAALRYEQHTWDEQPWQQRALAWLRDHVSADIPRKYRQAVLGHEDLHLGMRGELFVKQLHHDQRDPFTGEIGWWENVGRVSQAKVTTAFRDFLALQFVTDSTLMGDYKFHRVGTSATAEPAGGTDTTLVADAGLEAVGNQTNPTALTYQTVATIVADTTETWQEHQVRNLTGATGGTMLDRSLVVPTVGVVNLDSVAFTYLLTLSAEA